MVTWRRLLGWAAIAGIVEHVLLFVLAKAVIPPLVVIGLILAVGAFLLRRPGKAGPIVCLVGFLVFVGGHLPFAIPDLMEPASLPTFAVAGIVLVTGIVGITAAIAALRRTGDSGTPRTVARVAAGLAAVLFAANIVASTTYDEPDRGSGDVAVAANEIAWENEKLTAPAGKVTFFLDNKDAVLHNFHVKDQGTAISMPAKKAARGALDLKAGSYEFVCDFHADTMKGTLTVT